MLIGWLIATGVLPGCSDGPRERELINEKIAPDAGTAILFAHSFRAGRGDRVELRFGSGTGETVNAAIIQKGLRGVRGAAARTTRGDAWRYGEINDLVRIERVSSGRLVAVVPEEGAYEALISPVQPDYSHQLSIRLTVVAGE